MSKRTLPIILMTLATWLAGCDTRDERLHQLSQQSLARQAEQNKQMARQSQTTVETTKRLVDANAQSRIEFQKMQEELQAERASLDRQHERLEQERRTLARERKWESILGPLLSSGIGLIVAVLPLLVCIWLLRGLFGQTPDEQIGEVLIGELIAENPLLLKHNNDIDAQPAVGTVPVVEEYRRRGLPSDATISASAESKLLIIVEGQHDVAFLKQISTVLHEQDQNLPHLSELESAGQVLFVPTGGGDLSQWTNRFAHLNQREFHLYDREVQPLTDERQAVVAGVNRRADCQGVLTRKRSIENYLHPAAVQKVLDIDVAFADDDNVAESVAVATLERRGADWHNLSSRSQRKLRERAKQRLHRLVVPQMTVELLAERDPDGEVEGWLRTIATLLTD